MNISSDYSVVEDTVVIVKIKNWILQNITLTQNFRNEQIEKDVFDENIEISIKRNIIHAVNDRN